MKIGKTCGFVFFRLVIIAVGVFADTFCPTEEEYGDLINEAVNNYFADSTYEKLAELLYMFKVYATHDFSKCLGEMDYTKPEDFNASVEVFEESAHMLIGESYL